MDTLENKLRCEHSPGNKRKNRRQPGIIGLFSILYFIYLARVNGLAAYNIPRDAQSLKEIRYIQSAVQFIL